ncbi:isochorismatase family protein [Streptomyces sp. NPDC048603]|uniref:isochorismatase family protein n=1 Tax=Streptomyces sp. NPDC048603 TaxID=3365577 RepID=UPI00371231FF
MPSTTLRDLSGFDQTPAVLASSTLILVDYQNTYTQGVMELVGWQAALEAAALLLARAREAGATVIHVINDGGEGGAYDIRQDIGRIHPSVAPVEGEEVVVKTTPNAFNETNLGELVDKAGHQDVVIAGFMTHMCIQYSAHGAFLRGNRATVVADASATRSLPALGAEVPAAQVHAGALATIEDLWGVVVPSVNELG